MTTELETLTHHLSSGRLPMAEALREAMQIVDALRHAHEEGYCHGGLTPESVVFNGTSVELLPAHPGAAEALTPYTAPERLKGQAPDARTDIFACGAILYEMFSGHQAFEGDDAEALADAIENSTPSPIGDTGLDRVIFNCLVKEPANRWQRVQQVQMELKILAFSANRARTANAPKQPNPEVRQLELRITSRLDQQAHEIGELKQSLGAAQRVEERVNQRMDEKYGEVAGGLMRLAAEVPLVEAQLLTRLEQHREEAKAGIERLAAELPEFQTQVASRMEHHEQKLEALQALAQDFPELETRLISRLQEHSNAIETLHQATADMPELESRLAARLEEHKQAIDSRLHQHGDAIEDLHHAAGEISEIESRLAARLQEHKQSPAW